MKKDISILEISKRLGISWRTALDRLSKGDIPGRYERIRWRNSKRAQFAVDRQVYEKWEKTALKMIK